jgi:hypothetical protein
VSKYSNRQNPINKTQVAFHPTLCYQYGKLWSVAWPPDRAVPNIVEAIMSEVRGASPEICAKAYSMRFRAAVTDILAITTLLFAFAASVNALLHFAERWVRHHG